MLCVDKGIPLSYCFMSLLGFPFKWAKTRGSGSVTARDMFQGLGRLGFAAIALDWERPFLGPLYAWSSAIQGKTGPMKLPVMLRVLMSWLADRLEGGDRLQKPDMGVQGAIPLVFYTDAKAEDGRAWIGGFLEISPPDARALVLARS